MSNVVYTNYEPVSQRTVFKFRIAVHTLGQQFVDDNSLLVGSDLSVRVDMQLANDEDLGRLLLDGRDQTQSGAMIYIWNIKASGCPRLSNNV